MTGACGYVGRETLGVFTAAGHACFGLDRVEPNPIDGAALPDSIAAIPCTRADVSNWDEMTHAVDDVANKLGGLDVLICNAGVMDLQDGDIFSVSEGAWDRTLAVNAKGYLVSARASLPYLLEGRGPSIVMVGSLVALRGSATAQLAYTASKGAVMAMSRELAVSLASHGVRVNCVCPGPLDGGVLSSRINSAANKERRTDMIPLGRLGLAEDVAKLCLFLAGDDSSYISGTEILVDGGAAAAFIRTTS